VRPEFLLTYALCAAIFIISSLKNWQNQVTWIRIGSLVLFSALLLVGIGNPISGGRSFVAFGQHFAGNWVTWTGDVRNSWTHWRDILYDNFGQVSSTWEAMISNPSLFLKHIFQNIKELIRRASYLPFPPDFTTDMLSKVALSLWILGLCISNLSTFRKSLPRNKNYLLIMGLFTIPVLISTLVIYPRHHYMLFLIMTFVISLTIIFGSKEVKAIHPRLNHIILAALFIIGVTPYLFGPGNAKRPQPELKTIRFVQSLGIEKPVNMLDAQGGIDYYLDSNYDRVHESHKSQAFSMFLEKQDINMILITPRLLNDTRYIDDKEWADFLLGFEERDFIEINIPVPDRKLLVKSDLLP
jgi:hypothetical protein